MIVATRSGDVQLRSAEWGSSSIIPSSGSGYTTSSGAVVTDAKILGLPAVSNVIRSPSEVVASLPFMVYRGQPRTRAERSWQWQLLHEEPDDEATGTFNFFYDIGISIEASSNCIIQKVKSNRRVEALRVIDPQRVKIYRDRETQRKMFDIWVGPGDIVTGLTTDDILHIRGHTWCPGGVAGMPLLTLHRDALSSAFAMQGFEGDYFRNSAMVPFFLTGAQNEAHAKELLALHNQVHQGPGKQFRVGALWGDIDVKPVALSMVDAQFAETKKITIEDACRIWRWPKELLEITEANSAIRDENAWEGRVLKIYVLPRLRRIERAFAADKDLFMMSGLVGEFLTAALERADFVTRMRGYKDARQGGWLTSNEIRDPENLPPRPDGDSLLETPTGSAPNASNDNGASATESQSRGYYQNGNGEVVLR